MTMRLLNTTTFALSNMSSIEDQNSWGLPRYAILSHRWIELSDGGEITFSTLDATVLKADGLRDPEARKGDSSAKIRGACEKAKGHGLDWIWLDTVCIDKSNSAELDRALNSMFQWYNEAVVCYSYLLDVVASTPGPSMFRREKAPTTDSEWFERGWTLQELLVPQHMIFYDKNWQQMGTKTSLAAHLENPTHISAEYLNGRASFLDASVATKMSWMAGRTTKEVEDIAYSMLGILKVSMTPQYGEGIGAFARLQDAIITSASSFDESIFAWRIPSDNELRCYRKTKKRDGNVVSMLQWRWSPSDRCWGLLAPSPDCFRESRDMVVLADKATPRLRGGFQRTNQGVHLALPFKETKTMMGTDKKEIILPLNCWMSREGMKIGLKLKRTSKADTAWRREGCDRLEPTKARSI